ncbi:hypothetical protein R5R35_004287 [Gryllus longicercus]|uniref:Uncharacterized protein n=1 Tax=Gryllus longicercus TaxID=2509291 RepID=A0AAN9Z953_9ORTH
MRLLNATSPAIDVSPGTRCTVSELAGTKKRKKRNKKKFSKSAPRPAPLAAAVTSRLGCSDAGFDQQTSPQRQDSARERERCFTGTPRHHCPPRSAPTSATALRDCFGFQLEVGRIPTFLRSQWLLKAPNKFTNLHDDRNRSWLFNWNIPKFLQLELVLDFSILHNKILRESTF